MTNARYLFVLFVSAISALPLQRAVIADPAPVTKEGVAEAGFYGGYVHPHWASTGDEFWYESFGPDWRRRFWWVSTTSGQHIEAFDCEKLHTALEKAQVIMFDRDFIQLNDMRRIAGGQIELDLAGFRFRYSPASNDIAYEGEVLKAPRPLHPLESVSHLLESEEETTITFINHRFRNVTIWKVDDSGNETNLGPVSNWEEFYTHVGGNFLVKSESGRVMGIFQAIGDPSQADIDDLPDPGAQKGTPGGDDSPDGIWQAFCRNDNLFIREKLTGSELQLTTDGRPGNGYPAGSRLSRWSPDSKKLFAIRSIHEGTSLYLVQSSPGDQLQPKVSNQGYFRPTDPVSHVEPQLFDISGRREVPITLAATKPYWIRWPTWDADSQKVYFTAIERDFSELRYYHVDASSGVASILIDERSKTFVDSSCDHKCMRFDVPNSDEFVWTSERDGWNHAYLYETTTGELKNRITQGNWVVRGIIAIDPKTRQILFKASGLQPGEDPYDVHVCRMNLDGTSLIDLTPARGMHEVSFSPDDRFYLDTYSRVDFPPVTELRRSNDAKLICTVEKADFTSLLATGWRPPEQFVAKGRDGATDIYGLIYHPRQFNGQMKYPVIEDIYAGPHTANVPKQFIGENQASSLANLGFIVVQIDGMGTNFRSKAFQDMCWHNLADAGFPDRILWIKAAAAKHPEMDLSRIGIYGSSSGGENAVRALESYGDFYKVAVAGFGNYDDRLNGPSEQWMGWPIGPCYKDQADVTDAAKIKGKLFLITGDQDHTVDPSSTMQMVNALIKADKDFDLLIIPNADHNEYGDYGERRRNEFFVRNLLNEADNRTAVKAPG